MTTGEAAVRPFSAQVPDETLKADLENFRQRAMELGAAAAEIIPASLISVDERVRLKCTVPRCLRAGETPNCPPHVPDLDVIRKAFSRYSWAILLKTHVEPIADYAPQARTAGDKSGPQLTLLFHKKTGEIVCEVERMAYGRGYYLAMGFGGGSCKDYLCRGMVCQFLDSGRCRFPHRSRPSMEAMGINVIDLIKKVGWETYPLCGELDKIPCATSVGLVFIT